MKSYLSLARKELKAQIPIPVKLFGLRLDKIEKAQEICKEDIVSSEIQKLRKQQSLPPQPSAIIQRLSA